jgi:hypothetical protein
VQLGIVLDAGDFIPIAEHELDALVVKLAPLLRQADPARVKPSRGWRA